MQGFRCTGRPGCVSGLRCGQEGTMSKVLESAILHDLPGARRVHVDNEFAYVEFEGQDAITRYRLSPEAQRIALLEREGRPLDMPIGTVDLLPVEADDTDG